MLVISRRAGESFMIGHDIEVDILDCTPSHVKIGIRAPKQVSVVRAEILASCRENVAAARDGSRLRTDAANDILSYGTAVRRLLAHFR